MGDDTEPRPERFRPANDNTDPHGEPDAETWRGVPHIHPGIAETCRRRIVRPTAALNHPDDAADAAEAIREIVDRILLTAGPTHRDLSVTLQGKLGTILAWIERTGKPGYRLNPGRKVNPFVSLGQSSGGVRVAQTACLMPVSAGPARRSSLFPRLPKCRAAVSVPHN